MLYFPADVTGLFNSARCHGARQLLLLGLLPEELLGLGVVHQDLRQVFLVQDEEVGEAVRLDVGSASVPSASCQQTAQ